MISSIMSSEKQDTPNSKITLRMNRSSARKSCFIKFGEYLKEYTNDPLFEFSNFEFLKLGEEFHVIGSGASAEVFLARNKKSGRYYAIKQIDKEKVLENGMDRDFIMREINIHRRLVHDNIVRLYSHFEDETHFYLIMDYVSKGTLYQVIRLNNGLDEPTAFKYFIQAVTATHFLHENNLIHRDLKPENLLLDENDDIKLCDFGWCVELKIGSRVTFCGTFEYMAPELIKELPYDYAVDVWSLGVLLYELIHGYSPFVTKDTYSQDDYTLIFKNILKNNLQVDSRVSEKCADLITKLLTTENQSRIKIKDIFNHPWVLSYEQEYKLEKLRKHERDSELKKQMERQKIEIDEEKINVPSLALSNLPSISPSPFNSKLNSNNNSYVNNSKQIINQNNFDTFQNKIPIALENSVEEDYKVKENSHHKTKSNNNIKNFKFDLENTPQFKIEEVQSHFKMTSKFDMPKSNLEDLFKHEIMKDTLNFDKETDSLFDKVLSQITTKNKNKRKKTQDQEELNPIMTVNSSNNYSSNSNSVTSKASLNNLNKLQLDNRISLEIKSEDKQKSKTGILKSNTPRFSQTPKKEAVKLFAKNDAIDSYLETDEKDTSILNNFNLLMSKSKLKKDHLSIGESRLSKEDDRESSKSLNSLNNAQSSKSSLKIKMDSNKNISDYNTALSTESNLNSNANDISTYESYYNNSKVNKTASSVEMLERARKNRNKIAQIEVIYEEKNEGKFWSGLTKLINPFKCDKI